MQDEFDFDLDDVPSAEETYAAQEQHWRDSMECKLEASAHGIASEAKFWGSHLAELNEHLKAYGYKLHRLEE